MIKKIIPSICPKNKKEWREWLESNHITQESIWLIIHKKGSETPSITWSDAVDEALCFGWIDSIKKPIDTERYRQFFGKRKAESTWSKINKQKVALFIEQGLMAEAGLQSIEIAKENGSWSVLEEVEELSIPVDLEEEFAKFPNSKAFFLSLSKSARKALLQWIVLAKRTETRDNRIKEIAKLASQKLKPKQF